MTLMADQFLRSFVAIPLAPGLRRDLAAWQRTLAARVGGVKWVEEENFHLTLKFLGDTPRHAVGDIQAALERVAAEHGPFEMVLREAGVFPPAGTPRVLWVGADGGEALASLQRGVDEALAALGWKPEDRAFQPHLTVGRVRREGPRGDLGPALITARNRVWGAMVVDGFALMQSTLTPRGPIYRELKHFPLAGAPESG